MSPIEWLVTCWHQLLTSTSSDRIDGSASPAPTATLVAGSSFDPCQAAADQAVGRVRSFLAVVGAVGEVRWVEAV